MGRGVARGARRASAQAVFAEALRHHQGGRLDSAERLYRQVLAVQPAHGDSLHLLGVVAQQTGRPDLAITLIGRAIVVNRGAASYHSNLGNALVDRGRLDEAAAAYRRSVTLAPDAVEGHVNLGGVLVAQGHLLEAIESYRRALALRPDLVEAHSNLAQALTTLRRLDEAVEHCRRAIALAPDFADAHVNLGAALIEQGQADQAMASLRTAVALRPDDAVAHVGLGNALVALDQFDAAIDCFRRAIALRPDYQDGHNNLGNAWRQSGRLDEASSCFRRALALRPDYADALVNLGGVLRELGHYEESVAHLGRLVALRPDWVEGHKSLGNASRSWGQLDEAIGHFRAAVACCPTDADAQTNLAMALLARGDYAAGWEAYESRWGTERMVERRRDFAQPQWRGEAGDGRTLLVHAEQGLGDTIQFCRTATLAAARGWRVVVEVPRTLVRLLRSLTGVALVVGSDEALPPFDAHCPMLSMPLALGLTVSTIPGDEPYLHAEAAQAAHWRKRLAAMAPNGRKVGLVWAGNSHASIAELARLDRRRSLQPWQVAPLVDVPGVRFFSLQKDRAGALPDTRISDPMEAVVDFADTAAIVANLDLVISVDTAVAHLAAALGRPVWLLDRYDPCWRWLLGRRDSPWYPSLRLYRQPRPGDWDVVLAEIARDLRDQA